jgi:hypothetical protein
MWSSELKAEHGQVEAMVSTLFHGNEQPISYPAGYQERLSVRCGKVQQSAKPCHHRATVGRGTRLTLVSDKRASWVVVKTASEHGSEISPESDHEDDCTSCSGRPSPDRSLKARKREDSVGLLSPSSSQPGPGSLLGSRNGSATSLVRISGALRSRSRSRNTRAQAAMGVQFPCLRV